MKTITYFVQAPADIPYFLQSYVDNKKEGCSVNVFVCNTVSIYKLISKFKLDLNLFEYLEPCLFNPYKLLLNRAILRKVWKDKKGVLENSDTVIFFSRYEDILTSYFIHRTVKEIKRASVIYANHYDPETKIMPVYKIKGYALNIMRFLLTGIWYRVNNEDKLPELKISNYPTIKEVLPNYNKETFTSYMYKPTSEKSVLILFNAIDDKSSYSESGLYEVLKTIIDKFKSKGYNVYGKGHPRTGVELKYANLCDNLIENHFISELIDFSTFDVIIGSYSTAVAHAALEKENNTFSIVNMIECDDENYHHRFVDFLNIQSHNHLQFPYSIDEMFLSLGI